MTEFQGAFAASSTGANSCLTRYATTGEGKIARRLVRNAIALGCAVSVNDGEETTVIRSVNQKAITDALCTTGEDVLTIYGAEGNRIGSFWLIYGNDESGDELIADHTDNEQSNALYSLTMND